MSGRYQNPEWDTNMFTGLATLRRDGFASLDATEEEGSVITRKLTFEGNHLFVNTDASKGQLLAEVLDEYGNVIRGFSKEDCIPITENGTKINIQWKGKKQLDNFSKPIKVKFYSINSALYSFWISKYETGESGGYTAGGGPRLHPSGKDLRPTVVAGSIGPYVSQKAANFTAPNTTGGTFDLSDYLAGGANASDAVVLYFTMWCPICMGHTDHLFWNIIPQFTARGTTTYILVDYVSGSISSTTVSEMVNGYAGSIFTTIADENQSIMSQLQGAMGKTIVIDSNGIIQMNEDFRTGANLVTTLDRILP